MAPDLFRVPPQRVSHAHFSSRITNSFINNLPVQGSWRGFSTTSFITITKLAGKGSSRPHTRHTGWLDVAITFPIPTVYQTWDMPTLIGQQLAKSAINRRAISDNKEEYILFKQSVFPTTHILLKRATEY